jgi:hypothetical protein
VSEPDLAERGIGSGSPPGRAIEEREHAAAWREPRFDIGARTFGIAIEGADAYGEDQVEAALAEIEFLEGRDEELRLAGFHVGGVAPSGRRDHLRRSIDGREPTSLKPFAHQRRRDAVAAADLEHAVIGPNAELIDDRL